MLTERTEGASIVNNTRICGWPARGIKHAAFRNRYAFHLCDPHLAQGDRTGRHIQQDGFTVCGHSTTEGIGLHALVPTAPGRDKRRMTHDIDEVNGYQTFSRTLFPIGTNPAQVVVVTGSHADQTGFPDSLDTHGHGLTAHHLAKTLLTIGQQHGAPVLYQAGIVVHPQVSLPRAIHIVGDHTHTVGVVSLEVGIHQVFSHLAGSFRGCAQGFENAGGKIPET